MNQAPAGIATSIGSSGSIMDAKRLNLQVERSSHDARLNETHREGPNDTSCNGADAPNSRSAPHKDCRQHGQQIAISDCGVKVVTHGSRKFKAVRRNRHTAWYRHWAASPAELKCQAEEEKEESDDAGGARGWPPR